jgi:hypothetical protein
LEVWKTFPETVKTAVLIFVLSSAAVFWTKEFSPNTSQPELKKVDSVETAKSIDSSTIEKRFEGAPKPRASASKAAKNNSTFENREQATSFLGTPPDAILHAEETLSRGNYAEAYRQLRRVAERLPDKEKQRIIQHLQESAGRYEQGQFREAAYELQRAFGSNTL